MAKTPIIATGLNGLVGSKFRDDFNHTYEFQNLDIRDPEEPVDITNASQILDIFKKSPAQWVLHLAAFTDVSGAWDQRNDKNGPAYQVNVTGTKNIVEACKATGKHLIHISTAYVFDGNKEDLYTEEDSPNPIEWYGETKYLAELEVEKLQQNWTILRIDQPFRSDMFPKEDTAHRIIRGLKSNSLYPQFIDHYFGPTYIDDFSKVVDWVIRTKASGLFHASSGEKWSDFDFAQTINSTLHLEGSIQEGHLDEYLKTLKRPYQKNTAMNCEKLKSQIDFKLKSIQNALLELK